MKIVVCGPRSAIEECGLDSFRHCELVEGVEAFANAGDADAFINLNDDALSFSYKAGTPVIVNSVTEVLPQDSSNLYRINGWPGFLKREGWEIAGERNEKLNEILASIGRKAIWVKDEPGLVSARVISMIVNEAYFAVEDKVSSRDEIDTAMKLGTGYPFGPFEWAAAIGEERISKLLQLLALRDERYAPSILLAGNQSHP